MLFKDKFRFVTQNMKKNKSRIFMTVLATAMGCSFLIMLASVGYGLQRSVIDEQLRGRLVTEINIHGKHVDDAYERLGDEDIAALEQLKHVKAVTRKNYVHLPVTYSLDQYQLTRYSTIAVHLPAEITSGFELSEGRLPQTDNEIIIGYNVSDFMLKTDDSEEVYPDSLIGKTVQMTVTQIDGDKERTENFPVTIVGIGQAPAREWNQDYNVYISATMFAQIEGDSQPANAARSYDEVNVYADNMKDVDKLTATLENMDYSVYSVTKSLKQINVVFTIMKAGLVFIGTIAVLIASIGIYNTMTMAVTERSQDIGIMKAIGAHPKTIRGIFLIESTYIGVLGAVIGTVVSYLLSFIVNFAMPLIIKAMADRDAPVDLRFSEITPSLVVIAVSISLGVAILSGMRPAKRATQVDVLKALRRDV